jgi:dienelactone hydrolase
MHRSDLNLAISRSRTVETLLRDLKYRARAFWSSASRAAISGFLIFLGVPTLLGSLSASMDAQATHAQSIEELPKGKIIQTVTCLRTPGQSYAVYLPSNYVADTAWPILYCFDPGAHGTVPVGLFAGAAEKYGYIVVGSNNSQNGPAELANTAFNAMWTDTHDRWTIEDTRIYTAGFSGGARVAIGFALVLPKNIAGVVACSGGMPAGISPPKSTSLAFFCTAGNGDFNFSEMVRLTQDMERLSVPSHLEVFSGSHSWAPKELCGQAIEWMEVQALRSGRRARNAALIDELLEKALQRAKAHEAAFNLYAAFADYSSIARDFKGLRNVEEYEKKGAELKGSAAVKDHIKQERSQIQAQDSRTKELFLLKQKAAGAVYDRGEAGAGSVASIEASQERSAATADLKKALANLRKRADSGDDTSESLISKRVLGSFLAESYETAESLLRRKGYLQAAANLEWAAEARPSSSGILYALACAYSLGKQNLKAIEALKRAVENGFSDRAAIESDKDLDPIRQDPAFKKIVEAVDKKKT